MESSFKVRARVNIAHVLADTNFSGRIVEVCHETSRFIVRFEGLAPEIGKSVAVGDPLPAQLTEREQYLWMMGFMAGKANGA